MLVAETLADFATWTCCLCRECGASASKSLNDKPQKVPSLYGAALSSLRYADAFSCALQASPNGRAHSARAPALAGGVLLFAFDNSLGVFVVFEPALCELVAQAVARKSDNLSGVGVVDALLVNESDKLILHRHADRA